MTAPDDLVEVHLRQLPVRLWARSQEQHDALMREFALMSVPSDAGERERHVPTRLTELMDTLTADFEGVSTDQEQELFAASAAGTETLDQVYRVPAAAAAASKALGQMLDEADEYCRQGQHLLTLASDDELVRFRWWYLDQFIDQTAGKPPVAWPDYRR
ncbi:MAG: hypothetical protein QOE84_2798 [Actinomycetota bacterium]|jgi:hypothetical protein|nr:hypothetical protein [Actinomycetota bacterium]